LLQVRDEFVGQAIDNMACSALAKAASYRCGDGFQARGIQTNYGYFGKTSFKALGDVANLMINCCGEGNLAGNCLVVPRQEQIYVLLAAFNLFFNRTKKA